MEELGVSRRTLFRDMKMLQLAGVPYYHDPGLGYKVAKSFFLPPISLTVPETLGLMLLGKDAAGRRRRPLVAPALDAIHKLTGTVPEPIRSACADLMTHVTLKPDRLNNENIESRYYANLQRCIDEQRTCQVIYKSPVEAEDMVLEFEPYALHFAARAWYVVGRTDLHREARTLKLVRIKTLQPLTKLFTRPKRFKVEDHLGQAWQLIPEGRVYQVELEFSAKVATNASEVRWHSSQKQRLLDDGRCRMSFNVDGLTEIAWWLCGYADQVVVLKPTALKRRVESMLVSALEKYSSRKNSRNRPEKKNRRSQG
jgi:proteasome accessory factor B